MSTRLLSVLAAALFVLTVLVRAPAGWLFAVIPSIVQCPEPTGTMWHGRCDELRAAGISLKNISWTLHAWPTLLGQVNVDVMSADPRSLGSANITLGRNHRIMVRDLHADLAVAAGLLPIIPNGWSGHLQLAMDRIEMLAGRLVAITGTATARDLTQQDPAMPFGNYELRFGSDATTITGALRDLGGPLAVTGTLAVQHGSEYELNGFASARIEAVANLKRAVEYLGPTDAQGRRPFSLAGTL